MQIYEFCTEKREKIVFLYGNVIFYNMIIRKEPKHRNHVSSRRCGETVFIPQTANIIDFLVWVSYADVAISRHGSNKFGSALDLRNVIEIKPLRGFFGIMQIVFITIFRETGEADNGFQQ